MYQLQTVAEILEGQCRAWDKKFEEIQAGDWSFEVEDVFMA